MFWLLRQHGKARTREGGARAEHTQRITGNARRAWAS